MMKKLLIIISLIFSFNSLSTEQINIGDRMKSQEFYLKAYPALFGNADFALKKDFKKSIKSLKYKTRKKALKAITELDDLIPEKILMPLIHWRYVEPNFKKLEQVLSYFMFYRLKVLRDAVDFPLNNEAEKAKALRLLKELSENPEISTDNVFEGSFKNISHKAKLISRLSNDKTFIRAISQTKLFSYSHHEHFPNSPDYSLSSLGLVGGNQVKVISYNDISLERIDWFNQRVIFNGGKLDFNSPYIQMPTEKDPKSGHIVFHEDPIFIKIKEMIDEAKDSIFIDIFLFGGTLGATLSEHLIESALKKKNPNFKVLLLHDYATNYNMKDEMMPIFKYIKDRIENEPEVAKRVMLMQANIQRHPPGIPFGITNLIPKTDEVFAEMEKRNTYYESKIDHSKVVVIDPNSDQPQAYFGSKNWTDHSGGYYYDDAIWVKGPMAALVQASYYRDIDAALTTDPEEQRLFFYKEEGYDNKRYLKNRKQILDWFKVKRSHYPSLGGEVVRLAEADVDGTIKNTRNILIDMIKRAKKNIFMEQLFIYDPYIVDALIKRKLQKPDLDIRILADHNGNFGLNGLPNTLFVKEMISHGIEVRARKTYGITAHFPNGSEKEYHQENHRKITSIDGEMILGGSSNLNPDTLQGSFREFGAQIFSKTEAKKFESNFLKDWQNSELTMDLDIENFQTTVAGKSLSKRLSAIINLLGSRIFRSKDKLERRY